jgi:hypothetical protein
MEDRRHRVADAAVEGLDQGDGRGVFGEILQGGPRGHRVE